MPDSMSDVPFTILSWKCFLSQLLVLLYRGNTIRKVSLITKCCSNYYATGVYCGGWVSCLTTEWRTQHLSVKVASTLGGSGKYESAEQLVSIREPSKQEASRWLGKGVTESSRRLVVEFHINDPLVQFLIPKLHCPEHNSRKKRVTFVS